MRAGRGPWPRAPPAAPSYPLVPLRGQMRWMRARRHPGRGISGAWDVCASCCVYRRWWSGQLRSMASCGAPAGCRNCPLGLARAVQARLFGARATGRHVRREGSGRQLSEKGAMPHERAGAGVCRAYNRRCCVSSAVALAQWVRSVAQSCVQQTDTEMGATTPATASCAPTLGRAAPAHVGSRCSSLACCSLDRMTARKQTLPSKSLRGRP